jgi:hypothetical protein
MLTMIAADENIFGITLVPNSKAVGLGKYLVQLLCRSLTAVNF